MGRKKRREKPLLQEVEITAAGAEGKAVGRVDDKVVFVPFAAPGDIIDVQVTKKKRSYMEGKITKFHKKSDLRIEPECEHFTVCGGCKWQHLPYAEQTKFKQKQVEDNLSRIGHIDVSGISPIVGAEKEYYYRNKLEYTFSNLAWLTDFSKEMDFADRDMNALGFHIPGMFDRVLDINHCYLQAEPSNKIRLAVKAYAKEHNLSFFDIRNQHGFLRNLIVRTASTGEIMIIVVFFHEDVEAREGLLKHLQENFPEITSLMYIINEKKNDSITDQEVVLFAGKDFMYEQMEDLKFKVGPKSFYQTNNEQAYKLYKITRDFANLTGDELVYDLYTGTGTIANFVAKNAKKVIGIEYVPEAIEDAKINSDLNGITNTTYFAGDMVKVLDDLFIDTHGKPDVIITDPPRAGMHPKVVELLNRIEAKRIVYVSCNPATQARDVEILMQKYDVKAIQPVDMFPQTHHVENVILLELKN
ncbi:MAG: 23S rRNA (uracil(1939)-C(5))-methyltransferase RlmD [Bacteroidetes bacterium]|nr:MAG: 23S rRNA (uracil(1939)-C(5))-methyltransferase RlmD [Bacteroidota bacterium]